MLQESAEKLPSIPKPGVDSQPTDVPGSHNVPEVSKNAVGLQLKEFADWDFTQGKAYMLKNGDRVYSEEPAVKWHSTHVFTNSAEHVI